MADDLNFDLMLEHLKAIRAEQGRTNERLGRVERRMDTLNDHVGALVRS